MPVDRERHPRAVVLLSGGVDSATTLGLAVERGFETHALTVRYGQRHAIEVDRARTIARQLGAASHRTVTLDLSHLSGSALTDAATAVPKNRPEDRIGEGIPTTYVPARKPEPSTPAFVARRANCSKARRNSGRQSG